MGFEEIRVDAELLAFDVVGIGDHAATNVARGAGDRGQRCAEKPTGARLGDSDTQS
jgi:hypothetical protein